MPKNSPISLAVIVAAMASFFGGGFMGAIFSWYANRPETTFLTYLVTTTTIATTNTSGLIPDLKIQLGQESIATLFAHTIDFEVPRGQYTDRIELTISLPSSARTFGISAVSPSPVHQIECSNAAPIIRCALSPVTAGIHGYKVVIATDQSEAPRVLLAAKNIELMSASEYIGASWFSRLSSRSVVGVVVVLLQLGMFGAILRRAVRVFRRISIVGKVLDEEGHGIEGAQVELRLNSHDTRYHPVHTDDTGDFIAGPLTKSAPVHGRIRITREGYETTETDFESPIVVQTLRRIHSQSSKAPEARS